MNLPWNWHETIIIFFQDWTPYEIDMNLPWKWHETNLKVTLIWYEYDIVNEVRQFWKFRESAMNYQTYMKPSCQIHRGFIADSSRIHRGFMSLSFKLNRSKSCQIHGSLMAVSCQFHGTFTSKPDLGTVCQSVFKKGIHKTGFTCRFGFFCYVLMSFFVICQIHVGFMALSWHFHAGFYIMIFG